MSTGQQQAKDVDAKTTTTDVAIAKTREVIESRVSEVLGGLADKVLHNFDGDEMNRWRLVAIATGGQSLRADDMGDKSFGVQYWYAHQIEIVDPASGEMTVATRIVLIDEAGESVAFVSDGIRRDLASIISLFGMGPYTPPIKVQIVPVRTRRGYKVYTLQPAT